MKLVTLEMMPELLSVNQGPCLSLYLHTHRKHPENLQDPIRFKNLVKQIEESLLQKYSADEAKDLLEPFTALGNDKDFWNHTLDGLAVLSAPDIFEVIGLPVIVEELAIVADSLHTKPLRKYLQSVDRFQVLGLSLHDMQLYEGNRYGLTQIDLEDDMPVTIKKALGDDLTEEHLTVASYGGVGGESSNMVHGQGSRKDELDVDAERYFRVVAREVYEHYSKNSGVPLILAALPEHHNLFQSVSNNPLLAKKGVNINPKAIPADELADLAWKVIEPEYVQRMEKLADNFNQSKAKGLGSDDIVDIAKAAVSSRVDTLLVEQNRIISGRISDPVTGSIQMENLQHPDTDDLLDDIAELVTKMGGRVMIIPAEKMPVKTGLAAVYRY